jgi:hypothetical protein
MSKRLMLDIETAPIDGVEQYLGNLKPRVGWKDEAKIKDDLERRSAKERDMASLDPDLCRVVALAFQSEDETAVSGGVARTEDEERSLLTRWWNYVRRDPFKPTYMGFNIAGFDLPVLMRRSQFLGVSFPHIRLGRYGYQMPDVTDLQVALTMDRHEKFELRSKDWWLKRLRLETTDNPCTGADVAALIALGDFDTVLAHCKADVANEVRIAQWLGLWPDAA